MTTTTEKSAMAAEEIASTVLDKWPNIEMECDIDQLRSDITQAIKSERQRVRGETIELCAAHLESIHSQDEFSKYDAAAIRALAKEQGK